MTIVRMQKRHLMCNFGSFGVKLLVVCVKALIECDFGSLSPWHSIAMYSLHWPSYGKKTVAAASKKKKLNANKALVGNPAAYEMLACCRITMCYQRASTRKQEKNTFSSSVGVSVGHCIHLTNNQSQPTVTHATQLMFSHSIFE